MSAHNRHRSVFLKTLVIAWLVCLGTDLFAQPPEIPGPPSSSPSTQPTLRKITFKHAKAADVLNILQQLEGTNTGIVVDERTNSLIFMGDDVDARYAEETWALLDSEPTSPMEAVPGVSPSVPGQVSSSPSTQPGQTFSFSIDFEPGNSIETLKRRYNDLEKQSHLLAGKFKDSMSLSETQLTDLHLAVRESFEARQSLQRAELAELARRMKRMQQSIDMRDKLADKIVQRRVDDLLNPKLKWEAKENSELAATGNIEPSEIDLRASSLTPVEQAVTRLLKGLSQPSTAVGSPVPIAIAVVGVDYRGQVEAGDLKESIYEQVAAQIARQATFNTISRRIIDAAMVVQALQLKDLSVVDNRQKLFSGLRSHEVTANAILLVTLKHLGDFDEKRNNQFEVTLEFTDGMAESKFEHVTINRDLATPDAARVVKQHVQGRWIIENLNMETKDLLEFQGPLELRIDGENMTMSNWTSCLFDMQWRGDSERNNSDEKIFPIDFVADPNGEHIVAPGIISCEGDRLRICLCTSNFDGAGKAFFRPSKFLAGSRVMLIECRRAPSDTARISAATELDRSTPQATLDYLHRYSIAHSNAFPAECFTEDAVLELSGAALQQLCSMSGLSQIGLQNGGVIGSKDNVPIISGTVPSFHIRVDALLKKHMLPAPSKASMDAYELLAKLTFGAALSDEESLVKPDRELLQLAAGILKSPKDFLPEASELMKELTDDSSQETDPLKKEPKQTPKYEIVIDGDYATATEIVDNPKDASSIPTSFKLQRIDENWFVSQVFSDEMLAQLISSMSSVLGVISENVPETKPTPPEWNDLLKLLPESGTALLMFSHESETREQMLPVAKMVAESASAQFIELPLTEWRRIIGPEATHFVLMKDRQLVGTRTGLMTETRLQDFVAKAKNWLTPRSTGVEENSLVRIDCYINPGTNNIGSQHGSAYPMTTAVIAVHGDQALLFGPESIANYIESGYACVAIVGDASGKQRQVPLDIVLKGPVKLQGRNKDDPKSAATITVTLGDGTSSEIPLADVESIYPKSVTEPRDMYDLGSAIYHIRGVDGLKSVKLAAVDDAAKTDQRVLSGSFTRDQHFPPIHRFRSPIQWQSQLVKSVGSIYGGNMNGAELFDVLCPTLPAPCGLTFSEHGRLIGKYGLGSPSAKDMTHSVFQPYAMHSMLHAALEEIEDGALKAALAETLDESTLTLSVADEKIPVANDAGNANISPPLTVSPSKFDTPQALLSRLDECSKNGSYEEFVALFTDEGVRDLAGTLMLSAMQLTASVELGEQQGAGVSAELDTGVLAVRKVLKDWLIQDSTAEQQQAMGNALSTMFGAIGGASPNESGIQEFIVSMRKSAESISDQRKFAVEMMYAYEKLTSKPFVYFSGREIKSEWQVVQFGELALGTLSDGSEPSTTITLQQINQTWGISSLFNELLNVAEPTAQSPNTSSADLAGSRTITRRYSVGSFVTESYFVGKGGYDTKQVYDQYESEIEQSLQELAKTVAATCTQPPKFVQVLSSSRCLLVGHSEAGHLDIANFMSDIGINNDRIRLRGFAVEITNDEAKSLSIELTQHVLSPLEVEKLRDYANGDIVKSKKSEREMGQDEFISIAAMDESIPSGTRIPLKQIGMPIPLTIAARIVPGNRQMQIRFDLHRLGDENAEYVAPRFQSLADGQSVLLAIADGYYWLATADIVHQTIGNVDNAD